MGPEGRFPPAPEAVRGRARAISVDNVTALTMEFVRNLSKSIRTLRAYSPQHRQAQAALQEAFSTLERMLQAQPSILLGTREGALILQGKPVRDASPATQGFCEMLAARNIATFAVEQGATLEEFGHLVRILSMNPEDLIEAQAIKPEHLKPLRHIRLNEMRFVAVKDGMPDVEGGGVALSGVAGMENLTLLLNSLLGGAAGEGEGGASGETGAARLQFLGAALKPFLGKAGQNEALEAASRNFDQIVEQSMANVPAARFVEEYLKGVAALPDVVKRAILETTGAPERAGEPEALIERLPLAMRGRILAEDLRRGQTDPAQLRQAILRLAPSSGEFVQLLETVSRLVTESAATPAEAEKGASSLRQLLPLSAELGCDRRSVFLLVRERDALAAHAQALEEAGFSVTACRYPDPNLGTLIRARAFDAVVADIGPYPLNQLGFLKDLRDFPSAPPLILIEDVLRMRQPEEMDLCSQARVLYKPLEAQKLVESLRESVPTADRQPPPREEVESARRIQRELVPGELPALPGYTLAARYEPGAGRGGNFHDVLALPERKYGLFLLDVAGSPAAVLRVLLAARTECHGLFLQTASAVQSLCRVNDLLAGQVPRGTFVRAVYAVLDPGTGQLTVAAAGHPRPMRWSREAPNIRVLQTAGAPLGLFKGAEFESTLHPVTVTLAAGDHVLFHTMDVAHAFNDKGEELGERGVARATRAAPEGVAGLALVEVVEAVLAHRGNGASDDFTLIELCRESQDA